MDHVKISLIGLMSAVKRLAIEHRDTLMIARTHGRYAEPATFGHMLLGWLTNLRNDREALLFAETNALSEMKQIAGPVGTGAGLDPRLSEIVSQRLPFFSGVAGVQTQILHRGRHALLVSVLACVAGTIEQMARTLWEMARSDCGEVEEGRTEHQRGSSAMAHKKNPIRLERLQGLVRLMRSYVQPALENIATPEYRDISASSVERHILPDATALISFMFQEMRTVLDGLVVREDRMRANLERTGGEWAGNQVRNALMAKGVSHSVAYEYIQQCAFTAREAPASFLDALVETPIPGIEPRTTAADLIGTDNLRLMFDPAAYVLPSIRDLFRRMKIE